MRRFWKGRRAVADPKMFHAGWAVGNTTQHEGDTKHEMVSLVLIGGESLLVSTAEARRLSRLLAEAADYAEATNG